MEVHAGQTTIGGSTDSVSENGADVHTSSRLAREQLGTLIREFLHVIHNLHKERKGVDLIKQQLKHLEDMRTNMNVDKDNSNLVQYVSKEMDAFCGNAIKKNFDPTKGQFAMLLLDEVFNEGFLSRLEFWLRYCFGSCLGWVVV